MKNYYYSENGCIKIGTNKFKILLLNGKGEGSFWIETRNKKDSKFSNCEFITKILNSELSIYESENNEEKAFKFPKGTYELYHKRGNIIIYQDMS